MSRLHDPGPGEILDRLTILALKIVHGEYAGRDTTHWKEEYYALDSTKTPSIPIVQVVELAAVNGALWQAEDEIRRLRALPEGRRDQWTGSVGNTWVVDVANVALRIATLNDRRAELVARINLDTGIDRGPEKLT